MDRLLIVDDEEHVVRYLCTMLESVLGRSVEIHRSGSASEALQVMQSSSIDLLLTDCRMPGMGGLELIERVHATWPETRVIVLSAYPEFDYIYRAGALGAARYILKSEDDDVIVATVRDTLEEMHRERSQSPELRDPDRSEGLLAYVDECDDVRRFLRSRECDHELRFSRDVPIVLVLGVHDEPMRLSSPSDRLRLRHSLQLHTERLFSSHARVLVMESDRGLLYWILQNRAPRDGMRPAPLPPATQMTELLERLQEVFRVSLGTTIVFHIHGEAVPWTALDATLDALTIKALEYGMDDGGCADAVVVHPVQDPITSGGGRRQLVRRIMAFVAANMDGDLTLANLSRNVYYNPFYISRVFKQVTGRNLNTHIANVRIEKAKALLSRDDRSIAEIAVQCGYESPQYFTTVFRKAVGLPPAAFREQVRQHPPEL